MSPDVLKSSVFRDLSFMGVIRVNEEAHKVGYILGDPAWANLGQGQPEVGDIPNAPPRINSIHIDPEDHAYGPVAGLDELREAVAAHYNRLYRCGNKSQYTAGNVAIASGGRLALSRCAAALDALRLGYFTPDYTAYEDLLTTFGRLDPVRIELAESDGFQIDPARVEERVAAEELDALLISNPCNPTGVVIQGDGLRSWVELSRRHHCMLIMDEFYSHYVYDTDGAAGRPVSSADFVEEVNEDRVLIFDGLTKCYRYPGWRLGWVVGPADIITTMTACGSFLDGGPSRPIQRVAIDVLKPDRADQEVAAVRAHFARKQRVMIGRLRELDIEFPSQPGGTFYAWGKVANLPAPLNDGIGFMHEAFKHRVLTVPGEYFDVNPNRQRAGLSPLAGYVRFSFGPTVANIELGLDRLTTMVGEFT